jgi:CHAT domain-containing protein/tetratricopeptide (TPR) repeat protein
MTFLAQTASRFSAPFALLTSLLLPNLTPMMGIASIVPFLTAAPTPIAQAETPKRTEADRLFEEGAQAFDRQEPAQGLPPTQKALELYRQQGDRLGEARSLTNLGGLYYTSSQYQKAIDHSLLAVRLHLRNLDQIEQLVPSDRSSFERIRERAFLRIAYRNLGLVNFHLGQYQRARNYYTEALSRPFGRSLGDEDCLWDARIMGNMAELHVLENDTQSALKIYSRIFDILEGIGYTNAMPFPQEKIPRLPGQPPLRNQSENFRGSLRYSQACFSSLTQTMKARLDPLQVPQPQQFTTRRMTKSAQYILGDTLLKLGKLHQRQGGDRRAVDFYQDAVRVARVGGFGDLEAIALSRIAEIYAKMGDGKQSIAIFEESLAIGKTIGERDIQAMTLQSMGQVLLELGRTQEATQRLQSAVTLWESLRPGLKDDNQISLFETQTATYQLLQQAWIAQQQPKAALETAERGRARALVELMAQRISPQPNPSAIAPIQPPSFDQIRQVAQQQKATLVTYSLMPNDAIYIWVVSPQGQINFRKSHPNLKFQGQRLTLEEYVESTRRLGLGVRGRGAKAVASLSAPRSVPSSARAADRPASAQVSQASQAAPVFPDLRQLHTWLIDPIADLLPQNPTDRVVFIPQGALFLVPFPALQDPANRYLIERHTIQTAPSIQTLMLTQQQGKRSLQAPLIVGNPTMPKVTLFAGGSPEPLDPLPGAEQEAKAIAQLLKTEPLTGDAATKSAVTTKMSQAGIIHLATHGLLDDFRGLGVPGAIALAPSGQSDGLLTANEILDLRLQANLVVLSACDTGRGRITGDGVVGLSRSLLSAGTLSVVVSLWAVPDASTALLMTDFYRNLQTRPDKAQALRQAMLNTMKQYPNPADWAAFTLIGNAE